MKINVPTLFNMYRLDEFTSQTAEILKEKDDINCIEIDPSTCEFISPTGIVTLTAFMKYLLFLDLADDYRFKTPHPKTKSYLNRIDFNKNINGLETYDCKRRSSTGRFSEVQEINSEDTIESLTRDIMKILIHQSVEMPEGIEYALQCSLGEVMNNVFHHSNSPINGFVCAQTYSAKNKIEIAIGDVGKGIKNSFIDNNIHNEDIVDDTDAIKLALKKEITSRPDYNAGEGLFFTKKFIEDNCGKLLLYSGEGRMFYNRYNYENPEYKRVPYWQGTIVSLQFNTEESINIEEIYNNEYSEDDDYGLDFDDVF